MKFFHQQNYSPTDDECDNNCDRHSDSSSLGSSNFIAQYDVWRYLTSYTTRTTSSTFIWRICRRRLDTITVRVLTSSRRNWWQFDVVFIDLRIGSGSATIASGSRHSDWRDFLNTCNDISRRTRGRCHRVSLFVMIMTTCHLLSDWWVSYWSKSAKFKNTSTIRRLSVICMYSV